MIIGLKLIVCIVSCVFFVQYTFDVRFKCIWLPIPLSQIFWFLDPSHKQFVSSKLKSCPKFYCTYFNSGDRIGSQFWTCHDSTGDMACAKLWLDLIIIFHVKAIHILTRFGMWAHRPLVKQIPHLWVSVWNFSESTQTHVKDRYLEHFL